MCFARLAYRYRYKTGDCPHPWGLVGNLGDAIQSLAIEGIYERMGIAAEPLLLINRDDVDSYRGEPCILPMQGWFGDMHCVMPLPWSRDITPVFIGFHLSEIGRTRELFLERGGIDHIREFEPIGCRDHNTMRFLAGHGIDAYFSACMTLTFERRREEPASGKTFIVDVSRKIRERIPATIMSDADSSITHNFKFAGSPVSPAQEREFEGRARAILKKYREEATLVITERIHVAMPCIAMGIPVVFITNNVGDERFEVLRGLLPVNHYRDMKHIDWTPAPVDFDGYRRAILENAISAINGTYHGDSDMRAEGVRLLKEASSGMRDMYPDDWVRRKRAVLAGIRRLPLPGKLHKKISRLG